MIDTEAQSFTCALDAPAKARRFVKTNLEAWRVTEHLDDALLVVSELVTNAVLHAGTDLTVSVARRNDVIRLAVQDAYRVLPLASDAETQSPTGRGLVVVAAVARRWGADFADSGKVVWADIAR